MNAQGTFVSEKINKIRWRPDLMNESHFVLTGSWDNIENSLKLWDFPINTEDEEVDPLLISECPHNGDVTEAQFINADLFVTSSSHGSVLLSKISTEHSLETLIEPKTHWKNIHKFSNGDVSSCTAFSAYEKDIASVGEDGAINLFNIQSPLVSRKIENADSCSLQCVTFLKHNEIVVSNLRGQLKLFDARIEGNKPLTSFMLGMDDVGVVSLQHHPTQRHVVVAGDEAGSLTVWDLRQHTFPVNVLNAHAGAVNEIHFHSDRPDHLFTCSSAGDVWHWYPKSDHLGLTTVDNIWLGPESINKKLDVVALMAHLHTPINSLDVNRNRVVFGCDNEAIYMVDINNF